MFENAVRHFWGAALSFPQLLFTRVAAEELTYFLVAAAVITGVVTLWGKWRILGSYVIALAAGAFIARIILVDLVRLFYQTTRPYIALAFPPLISPVSEFSFPSGHTSVLVALALIAGWVRPAAGAALLVGALLVGIGRVFAGVHWPIDIAGGVLVGILAATIVLIPPYLRNRE